jgi:hypothetical protein
MPVEEAVIHWPDSLNGRDRLDTGRFPNPRSTVGKAEVTIAEEFLRAAAL